MNEPNPQVTKSQDSVEHPGFHLVAVRTICCWYSVSSCVVIHLPEVFCCGCAVPHRPQHSTRSAFLPLPPQFAGDEQAIISVGRILKRPLASKDGSGVWSLMPDVNRPARVERGGGTPHLFPGNSDGAVSKQVLCRSHGGKLTSDTRWRNPSYSCHIIQDAVLHQPSAHPLLRMQRCSGFSRTQQTTGSSVILLTVKIGHFADGSDSPSNDVPIRPFGNFISAVLASVCGVPVA